MSATRFVPEVRSALIENTAAGVSLADAANAASVRPKTVKDWLTRGRREDSGPYRDFSRARKLRDAFEGASAGSGGAAHQSRTAETASESQEKRPRLCGAVPGYREERYVSWRGVGGTQAPRGMLNRVEAVSAANAAPMPTRKIVALQAPVRRPTASPPATAKRASA